MSTTSDRYGPWGAFPAGAPFAPMTGRLALTPHRGRRYIQYKVGGRPASDLPQSSGRSRR